MFFYFCLFNNSHKLLKIYKIKLGLNSNVKITVPQEKAPQPHKHLELYAKEL